MERGSATKGVQSRVFVRVWSRARRASENSRGGSGLASQLLTRFGPLLSAIEGW
jgi:hypothetical protein